jgi:hypothetical protein
MKEQDHLKTEREALAKQTNADPRPGHEGHFWIKAPEFPPDLVLEPGKETPKWTVLNADFRENLIGRYVKPSDPLLRLGYKEGAWEAELRIPQKHIGQVRAAFLAQERNRQAKMLALLAQGRQSGELSESDYDDLVKDAEADKGKIEDSSLLKYVKQLRKSAMLKLLEQAHTDGRLKDEAYNNLRGKVERDPSARFDDRELGKFLSSQGGSDRAVMTELGDLLENALEVDILAKSAPTQIYKGRLKYIEIAGDANPHKDDNNESEPMVLALVRLSGMNIDPNNEDIAELAPHLLVSNTEAHTKIRCGTHRMGYSLFYGVWEFLYEKVIFFF